MNKLTGLIVGALFAAGLCAHAAVPAVPAVAAPLKGTWGLNNWVPGDSVQLKMSYRRASTRWEWSHSQPVADLHGLTAEQLRSTHSSVAFARQRDAGTFSFAGSLTLGLGRGDFRFDPDPTYATKLGVLGYDAIGDDALLRMALGDVSLAFASEVKFSGLQDVQVSDLLRLKDHGIDGTFVRALKSTGVPVMSADAIVKLHDHGVD